MKKLIIFKFDSEVPRPLTHMRQIRARIEKHIHGSAKFSSMPGFFVASFETRKSLDEITHELNELNWKFMIFDVEQSRAQLPPMVEQMFLEFPDVQPFMKEPSSSLSSTPDVDRYSWLAQKVKDPSERVKALVNRRAEMEKERDAHAAAGRYEQAARARDYIALIDTTIHSIQSTQSIV